jgi:DeoR family glycerol-3-phosphate regulon repressor/DeoR family fructose operon transcriptional repressor
MTNVDSEQTSGDSALPAKRRADILRIARQVGQITVAEMSARFDVSLDTIRRDLDMLSEQGLISRIHGGAVPAESLVTADKPFDQRVNAQHNAKNSIGRAAARLIADGETLVVNGGSTTLAFAAGLGSLSRLTIVTNNLSLPAAVPPQAVRNLYLLGGEIRSGAQITLGPVGLVGVPAINADTAVVGVGGVTSEGCWTSHLAEAGMMAGMIAAARRTIIVADSSKFGHHAFAKVVSLERIAVLVTDARPPADLTQALDKAGVHVVVAD